MVLIRKVAVAAHRAQQPKDLTEPPKRRLHSLDGLRGVAALVVVGYHLLLVVPTVSVAFSTGRAPTGSAAWILARTPIHLLFAGHEAVLIFFVLSGFVLTLPLRPRIVQDGSWLAYYGRRLVRLYLPVWAALVVAVLLAAAVARDVHAASPWLASHKPVSSARVIADAGLLIGTSNLNSPLWSLRWEMWFSLLLPVLLILILATRMHRWWKPGIVLLAGVSIVAQLPAVESKLPGGLAQLVGGLLQYLPVFGIGMLLALNLPELDRYAARFRGALQKRAVTVSVMVAALLMIGAPAYVAGSRFDARAVVAGFVCLIGVVVVLVAAIEMTSVAKFLERPAIQWLGSRSFSIYLVHEPILVAVALAVKAAGWAPWIFIAIFLVPVILFGAEGFYRAVERPTVRLSRAVGRHISDSRR